MSRQLFIFRLGLILAILAVSVVGTTVIAQGATVVRIDPATVTAKVNDNFNVAVKVDNIANLTAFELHLAFNPAVVEVVSLTNGGFIAADFAAQNVFDNTAGTIDYAVAQLGRPPANGSGALLTITFRAKANGTANVTLRATPAVPSGMLLSDANGMAIQAAWTNGSVTIGTGGAVTTPTQTPAPGSTLVPTATQTPSPTSAPGISTPTATPTITPVATAATGATLGTHTVRAGEHLYCIGRAYAVSPYAIANANHLFYPYLIFPNQKLTIPNVPWVTVPAGPVCQRQFTAASTTPIPTATAAAPTVTSAATLTATPTAASACRATYTVQPGDTLYRIATNYGTTYAVLAQANHLADATRIYAGQQLCIP